MSLAHNPPPPPVVIALYIQGFVGVRGRPGPAGFLVRWVWTVRRELLDKLDTRAHLVSQDDQERWDWTENQ